MHTGKWAARVLPRACRWCLGLLPVVPLVACGVAEPVSQATPLARSATQAIATTSTLEATALASPDSPTALPTASASRVPPTATLPPPSATIATGQLSATRAIPTRAVAATPAPSTPSAPSIPPVSAGAWQEYRSERAGYRVEHPTDWTVSEQANTDGSFLTIFSAGHGGVGIAVASLPGEIVQDNDLPNTRCEQVTIGGLTGTRCFDTITRSTTVTLVGQGKTFTIVPVGKQLNAQIFDRFLASFAPIAGA